jgi:coproporphyrinogen III oxidase-like Fe-S oxidoreductase
MYKSVSYSLRDRDEFFKEISLAAKLYPKTRRIFLADGDVMLLKQDYLLSILEALNEHFPRLTRVNIYANGSSILRKTPQELCELRKLKLHTLYMGLESGDEELLLKVNKGETASKMVDAVRIAQNADLRCSVMILLGLGGKHGTKQHALKTADALNQMQPRLLSALRYIDVNHNSKIFDNYIPLTEEEAVCELRNIVSNLELTKTVFRANHTSNPIPIEGRFPKDKDNIISFLNNQIDSDIFDNNNIGNVPLWL